MARIKIKKVVEADGVQQVYRDEIDEKHLGHYTGWVQDDGVSTEAADTPPPVPPVAPTGKKVKDTPPPVPPVAANPENAPDAAAIGEGGKDGENQS
jgi:hypothetical protein